MWLLWVNINKLMVYLETVNDVVLVEYWQNDVIDGQDRQDHADHGQRVNSAIHVYFTGYGYD